MKLKKAIKELREDNIIIHYDLPITKKNTKKLNKILMGAFPTYFKVENPYTYYWNFDSNCWNGGHTLSLANRSKLVKLSEIDFSKKEKDKLIEAFNLLEKKNIMMFKKTEQGAMYRIKNLVPDETYGHMCEFYDKLDLDLNNRVNALEEKQNDPHNNIDSLKSKINLRYSILNVRHNKLEKRVEKLENRLQERSDFIQGLINTSWDKTLDKVLGEVEKPTPLKPKEPYSDLKEGDVCLGKGCLGDVLCIYNGNGGFEIQKGWGEIHINSHQKLGVNVNDFE